jgi:hypothetical protein
MDGDEYEDRDTIEVSRARRRMIAELDQEIAELQDPAVLEEMRRESELRKKWESLPPVRLRPGVAGHRLSEQEEALLDREGY